jgi:signal peptidase
MARAVGGRWRAVASAAGTLALAAVGALGVAVVAVPAVTHGASLTVLTGSMQPTIDPGDLIVVAGVPDPASVEVGDVVTYMPYPDDPTLVTHRVVAKGMDVSGESVFTVRGDANNADDDPVYGHQLRGRMLFSVPKLGYVVGVMDGERAWIKFCVGAALFGYAALMIVGGRRRRRAAAVPTAGFFDKKDDAVTRVVHVGAASAAVAWRAIPARQSGRRGDVSVLTRAMLRQGGALNQRARHRALQHSTRGAHA